ncbi:hypothetical protein EXIGLDRAFT_264850 [Exidia glandulosa HHB12029]|uniref:Uncharacterized protein n=1 Tax=Exidia glandulosa HHB12029 TaxID=1314781 RepID=A0A165DQH6_EXIGL|nr:hypothetical protein EXIGLDRAFT_264850 [Exidia glandulosa HHB12029]
MMIEALTGITKSASATRDGVVDEDTLDLGYYETAGARGSNVPSTPSSSTTAYPRSSVTGSEASPSSMRSPKRNSSNLFGSGRFRDQSYIRNARDRAISQTSSSGSLSSSTPRGRYTSLDGSAASMTREHSSSTLASVRDEDAAEAGSGKDSGSGKDTEKTPVARPLHLSPSSPAPTSSLETVSESSLMTTLTSMTPARQKRMSLALDSALQALTAGVEMPPDDEDIVLAPRSARSPQPPVSSPRAGNGQASHRPPQLQRDLFVAASAQQQPHASEPIAPNSATSDEFDSASTFMLRDDDPFAPHKRDGIKAGGSGSLPSPTFQQRTPVSPTSMSPPRATSPRVPGYIPGMQRPTSPRDVERSDSTTPRATAPPTHSQFRPYREAGRGPISPPQLPATILSKTALPRSDSPAPGLHQYSHSKSSSFGALADWARFGQESPGPEQQQPISILKQTASSPGRPLSPPTNRTPTPGREGNNMPAWYANAAYYQQHISRGTTPDYGSPSHSRHGSVLSDETDPYGPVRGRGPSASNHSHSRTKSGGSMRSLTSPALPDSPLLDGGGAFREYGSIAGAWDPDARMSSIDIGVPAAVHAAGVGRPVTPKSPPFLARSPSLTRSPSQTRGVGSDSEYIAGRQYSSTPPPAPTPGLGRPRTPSRAMHSASSSASSSFNNVNSTSTNPLVLAPFNASAASVASAGSSYHSEQGDDMEEKLYALLHPGTKKRKWDDFAGEIVGVAKIAIQLDDREGTTEHPAEDILTNMTGLTKEDIVMIQRKLLDAALQTKSTVDAPASRPPSLRRRRGSIGQTMGGPQSPSSRTTSPGPLSPHVSPKNSVSPFNSFNSTPSLNPSITASSSSSSAPSLSPLSPLGTIAPSSPPYSSANLTGSDTEREKTPAPRQIDRSTRTNALLTSMMESIDRPVKNFAPPVAASAPPAAAAAAPAPAPVTAPALALAPAPAPAVAATELPQPLNYARPLSPQSPRAMSPIPAASISMQEPRRDRSPEPMRPHHDPSDSQSSDLSSIMRNKALADAIFGTTDDEQPVSAAQAVSSSDSSPQTSVTPEEEVDHRDPSPVYEQQRGYSSPSPVPIPQRYASPPPGSRRYGSPSPVPHDYSPSPDFQGYSPSPNKQGYNSSSPLPPDDAQLEQDVRRKVELATAALKQSPSHASLRDRSNSVRRKKINPNKISVPHLMSSSTSLDAVPLIPASRSQIALNSPNEPRSAGSKLTQRIKKLGGWRSKPSTPNTDEPPPFGHGQSPNSPSPSTPSALHPTVQTVRINPSNISNLSGPASASAADISHYRFPPSSPGYSPQSPPASAGPAFKSFMSKFAKPFGASSTDLTAPQRVDRERLVPQSPGFGSGRVPTSPTTPTAFSSMGRSDTARNGVDTRYGGIPTSPLAGDTFPRGRPSIDDAASARKSPELAIKQILDGAAQAGLDSSQMEELTALLNRSLSTSSRATATPAMQSPVLTRNNSIARPVSPPAPERKATMRSTRSPGPTPVTCREGRGHSECRRAKNHLSHIR